MWTEQGLRAAAAHTLTHTRSRTHTPHTLTRVHAPSEPLQTRGGRTGSVPSGSRKGRRGLCADGSPAAGPCGARPPPPGPLCLRREPGAMQACPRPLPPPPRVPGLLPEGRGRRRGSRRWLLWPRPGPGPAQPGPILFPFPLRNALTRRLLKKSCRKSILSRDCPQTRLDFY